MALNLGKAVVDFLTAHPEEKFSARQIAEWLFATFPDECNAKKASSQALETDADLLQQLVAEIGSQRPRLQKKHPNLKTTEGRPRKYYFSEKSDSAEVAAVENVGVAARSRQRGGQDRGARPVPPAGKLPLGRVRGVLEAHR